MALDSLKKFLEANPDLSTNPQPEQLLNMFADIPQIPTIQALQCDLLGHVKKTGFDGQKNMWKG